MLRRRPAAGLASQQNGPDGRELQQQATAVLETDTDEHHLSLLLHPPSDPPQPQFRPERRGGHSMARQVSPYTLWLLCTGCSLALLSQHMANNRINFPQAQIPAWTKYTANFFLSVLLESASGSSRAAAVPLTGKQTAIMAVMGLLDVLGYGLSSVAFAKCGAALTMVLAAASGQICTAVTRLLLLRKPLTVQQSIAVVVVSAGLVLRGLGSIETGPKGSGQHVWDMLHSRTATGVLLILLSAMSYSLLGVAYEWLMQAVPGKAPSQAQVRFFLPLHRLAVLANLPSTRRICCTPTEPMVQINSRMSAVSAAAITFYQVLYTWPRREVLIVKRLQNSGVAASYVLLLYLVFGGLFTTHSHLQGQVLGLHGAMSVGIVNAMRAVVVSVTSAALFCRPGSSSQCLTLVSGGSALLVTSGALLWAVSPAPQHGRLLVKATLAKGLPSYGNIAQLPQQVSAVDLQDLKED